MPIWLLVCVDLCYQEDTGFLQQPSTSADRTCENFEHVLLHSCRGQRVSLHGLCQRSSVKLSQVNVPAVVGMGTLVQLVATNIMLCSQWPCTYMRSWSCLVQFKQQQHKQKSLET